MKWVLTTALLAALGAGSCSGHGDDACRCGGESMGSSMGASAVSTTGPAVGGAAATVPARQVVRGQVVAIKAAKGGGLPTIVLDHEDIPGFMEAMRMTFEVEDASLVKGLAAGDKIEFGLVKDGAEVTMTIATVRKLPPETRLKLAKR